MSRPRGPRSVTDRLRRLLVILPWLMDRGEASIAELSERFDVSERELIRDIELAAVCGLPPFIDEMIDVFVDEGVVYVGVPRLFTKPLRLTAPEGFALLASGEAALQLPGADRDGPLGRALVKLAAQLGDGVQVDQPAPAGTDDLLAAAETAERLRIDYWSVARGETTSRLVTPRAVFVDRGFWYLVADDDLSGERRTFRVDRIEHLERTGIYDEHRPVVVPDAPQWFADSELPVVVVELASDDEWMVELYPIEHRHEINGRVQISLRVTSEAWLDAFLLRLGDRATVVAPAQWVDRLAEAARRVLRRYETSGS